MIGSLTGSGQPQSLEEVILDAILQWRTSYPIKLVRPSDDEVKRYYERKGVYKILDRLATEGELDGSSTVLKPLDKQRRRTG